MIGVSQDWLDSVAPSAGYNKGKPRTYKGDIIYHIQGKQTFHVVSHVKAADHSSWTAKRSHNLPSFSWTFWTGKHMLTWSYLWLKFCWGASELSPSAPWFQVPGRDHGNLPGQLQDKHVACEDGSARWNAESVQICIPKPGSRQLVGQQLPSRNIYWLVVWNIFYFPIYWESLSQLTNILQRGWNHQPV